jgi:hypothetical protein
MNNSTIYHSKNAFVPTKFSLYLPSRQVSNERKDGGSKLTDVLPVSSEE